MFVSGVGRASRYRSDTPSPRSAVERGRAAVGGLAAHAGVPVPVTVSVMAAFACASHSGTTSTGVPPASEQGGVGVAEVV